MRGLRRMATSLVGKVLSTKAVNKDGFQAVMRKICQTRDGVEIDPVVGNIFAFHFQNIEDKRRIISGGPWSFNDALIVLEETEGKRDIQRTKFNKAEFWIQIHNAPLICMTEEIGCFLGNIIGEVVVFDGGDTRSYITKFLTVRVILEIDKPLRRCLKVVVLGDGVESVMLVKYERLLELCKDEEFLFGFWMRAPTPARRTGNGGRRWFLKERTKASRLPSRDRESWRPLNRTLESDGDWRGNPRVGVADSFRQNPSLVSNSKRKEIVVTDVNGRNAETVGWPIISVSSNLQE
ncbi:hypothetical protein EZV62_018391 [Acer yangbiense]|uniref:DUF4283 domain-containing protein n=1 Tax=Acer yangbiense TaxID=1000413 RepID=A0A5C7HJM6_9ROSI|nr:hypothetical protein EZV62_018391 [Acer yangbiense]